MTDPVAIECPCPPKAGTVRHPDGDLVSLRETLNFRAALTVRNEFFLLREQEPDIATSELLAFLTEQYLLAGVESWTLAADDGPVPVNRATIRRYLLADALIAAPLADVADGLYGAKVIIPLIRRASESSPTTPTPAPTSVPTASSTASPKRRSRSSTSTTPTGATATTSASLAGASN